jgi:hypothetical protein
MKATLPRLVLPFATILAMGCGARSELDPAADESGGATGGGGNLGSGGHLGTGGTLGGRGGTQVTGGGGGGSGGGYGGYHYTGGTGGTNTGGIVGNTGGQAGRGPGGSSPSGGGTMSSGGMMKTGGTMSSGGNLNTGGMTNAGGKTNAGGSMGGIGGFVDGGSTSAGGKTNTGGSIGGAGGFRIADAGPDGKGGAFSPDANVDNRLADGRPPEVGSSTRFDGALEDSGSTCVGLASNEELIDDLNDGNRFIPAVNGRVGAWTDSDDGTPGGTMVPDPANAFTPTDTGDVCRKYAAYVKGTGFTSSGASFWFGLGSPYNASKYTGISFWAKIDSGSTAVIRVAFPDKDTFPDGGICSTSGVGPTGCWDHYMSRITLTNDWRKHTVYFSELSQDSWGLLATQFDPTSLYEVLFQISVNATFGIWIDDVAFTM